MPTSSAEIHRKLDALHEELCLVLDRPGTGLAKRAEVDRIIFEMVVVEPSVKWKNMIERCRLLVDRVLDAAEKSENVANYEDARSRLMMHLQGIVMHINSMKPRDY